MNTVEIEFDGVLLLVPLIHGIPLPMPHLSFDAFATYCGPGHGLGDWAVPDDIDDIIISPPCFIHDECFRIAEPTWAAFHHSNSVFLHNIIQTLDYFGGNDPPSTKKFHRYYRAVTYYVAVDSKAGAEVFWNMKRRQELI